MKQLRCLCLFLVILLCTASLSGCSATKDGAIFRYDLLGEVTNLDPQYTKDSNSVLVLHNMFEGLVKRRPDGTISALVAKEWKVSEDKLTYTFILREGATWARAYGSKDTEIIALQPADFLFTFHRIFDIESTSPFQGDFSAIANSAKVLSGELGKQSLGVKVTAKDTIEFTLDRPDPLFLQKLASSGAFPCHEEFFKESRGRYGLELSLIMGNGPFKLYQWVNDEYVTLRTNERYLSEQPTTAGGVNFFIGREDKIKRFLDSKADVLRVTDDIMTKEIADSTTDKLESEEITWTIVFNVNDEVWSMPLLRQALAYTADYNYLEAQLSENFKVSHGLVPSGSKIGEQSFNSFVDELPITFNEIKGRELYNSALENLKLDRVPNTILYVPDTGNHHLNMSLLQQGWQQHLSLYINVQAIPQEEIAERVSSGEYQMILVPITASGDSPKDILNQFTTPNQYGYGNPVFDAFVENGIRGETIQEMGQQYRHAQATLLDDAVVLPVYSEKVQYAITNNAKGIEIYPFGGLIYFKEAEKS